MFQRSYINIVTIENLCQTWECFVCGKKEKKDVMHFQMNFSHNLCALGEALQSKTYVHGPYSAFNVSDPKPRNIHKAEVRDRLVHHLIYKELYPYFDRICIYDSFSCRKEKGTHRACMRFNNFARKVSRNDTKTCYVLKCDVRKFFASIDHDVLYTILERHIADADIRWLIRQVVSSFSSTRTGVGLPLGNLTSQLLVNIYMHEFDMYMKQELKIRYYVRYADDFVILSENRTYLEGVLAHIRHFLYDRLHLHLHEGKVHITTYASGVDFLGWVHFPHYRQLRTTTKRRVIRKMKAFPTPQTVQSYRGLLRYGNTYKLRRKFEKLL